MTKVLGILLTNTGTPDSPVISDVKRYLKAFLSDPRVVRLPKIIWKPLLHALILPRRAPYSAKLYQKIWTAAGSPLRTTMLALNVELQRQLEAQLDYPVYVETGMHYGNPSISDALSRLRAKKIEQLLVLPLFPQYSTSTTETARDQVQACLEGAPELPYAFISHYAHSSHYLEALAKQIKKYHRPGHHLLFSFHGLPQYFANQGDPYPEQCQDTAAGVAGILGLQQGAWTLAYQSRVGYAKWLSPYTFETLQELARRGQRRISVVCPGFSVDCLETLEEIQIRGKEVFLKEGGEDFQYIPALNTEAEHITALAKIAQEVGQS
jgi:ferrochelatase